MSYSLKLFTAYAIVRTVPSAKRPNRRKKKSASYEVSQAQKAILLLDHTAKGASTSSEELNAQISPRTDDEHNLPYHEDYLQEH